MSARSSPDAKSTPVNAAKANISAWRKRRSLVDPDSPMLLQKRFDPGTRSATDTVASERFVPNAFATVLSACRDRLVRTPTIIVGEMLVSRLFILCLSLEAMAGLPARGKVSVVRGARRSLSIVLRTKDVHLPQTGTLFALDRHQDERYVGSSTHNIMQIVFKYSRLCAGDQMLYGVRKGYRNEQSICLSSATLILSLSSFRSVQRG